MRLSSMITATLLATGMLALATPTLAQSRPGTGVVSTPQPRGVAVGRPTADEYRTGIEHDGWRLSQEGQELTIEEAEERYGSDRVALAERVQALMDAGQCEEARRMASEAGERSMAIRVRQTCRRR